MTFLVRSAFPSADAGVGVSSHVSGFSSWSDITNQTVTVTIPGAAVSGSPSATYTLIDDNHGNPRAAWVAMGSPAYPTGSQLAQLQAAAQITDSPLQYQRAANGDISFTMSLIPYATVRVKVPLQYSAAAKSAEPSEQ
jgi:hypothetical protein